MDSWPWVQGPWEVHNDMELIAVFCGCSCAFFLDKGWYLPSELLGKEGVLSKKCKSNIPLQEMMHKLSDSFKLLWVLMWLSPCPSGEYSLTKKNPGKGKVKSSPANSVLWLEKENLISSVSIFLWNGNNTGDFIFIFIFLGQRKQWLCLHV